MGTLRLPQDQDERVSDNMLGVAFCFEGAREPDNRFLFLVFTERQHQILPGCQKNRGRHSPFWGVRICSKGQKDTLTRSPSSALSPFFGGGLEDLADLRGIAKTSQSSAPRSSIAFPGGPRLPGAGHRRHARAPAAGPGPCGLGTAGG